MPVSQEMSKGMKKGKGRIKNNEKKGGVSDTIIPISNFGKKNHHGMGRGGYFINID